VKTRFQTVVPRVVRQIIPSEFQETRRRAGGTSPMPAIATRVPTVFVSGQVAGFRSAVAGNRFGRSVAINPV